MRSLFRWSSSAIAGLLGAAIITIFNQNIEGFSESMGWNSFFKDGWRIVTELGLAAWITYGFFFFAGASIALWVDYWLRRWSEKKATEVAATLLNSRALLKWDSKGNMLPLSAFDNTHHVYAQPYIDSVLIMMVFNTPMPEGHIQVASNIKGLKWMESQMSERHAVLRVEGKLKGGIIHVEIVPPSAASSRRQQVGIWQDAIHFDDMSYFQRKAE